MEFHTVGITGRKRLGMEMAQIVSVLGNLLQKNGYHPVIEAETAAIVQETKIKILSQQEFAQHCDLIIVIGGDGSLLHATRLVLAHDKPVLGINRGRLGFLTDISPQDLEKKVLAVLKGEYQLEERFLLRSEIFQNGKARHSEVALNEVVLMPGELAHMIEFEIYIDGDLVCSQRADGQIIATPTGSTAYALSGGGPILHPQLDAIVLVPMFSHTLSNRPLVVHDDVIIEIRIHPDNETAPHVSCDGYPRVEIMPGERIIIKRHDKKLKLLHPKDYNYYETLRRKLHWQTKL